jgi:MFS family permease
MLTRLILTFHSLFVALFSPAAGYVADRFGRRNLLVFSLVLYALSGASGTFLTSLWAMLLGRALLGVSVAGVMTAAIALIGDYYTGSKRNEFMGLQSAFMAFGGVVFVTTGGALADIDWRGPFYVYLFALLIVPIALSCIYEPRRRDGPGSSQYASEGPIPVFHIGLVYLITFTSMVSIFMVPVLLPFHLANLTDVSNAHVGFAIGASIMAAGVSSLTYGRVKARMSFPGIVSVAFLLMATGYGVLSFSETYYMVILSLIITGAGNGFMMPNVNLWAVTLAPNRVRGRVVGGLTTFLSLGQFFSPILVQPLVSFTSIGHSYGVAAGILLSLSAIFAIGGSKLDKGQ